MKKRIINLIILLSGTLFIFIIVTGKFNVECLFKKIFHISCPGCGLTRSFRSILNLDFINDVSQLQAPYPLPQASR